MDSINAVVCFYIFGALLLGFILYRGIPEECFLSKKGTRVGASYWGQYDSANANRSSGETAGTIEPPVQSNLDP